MLLHIGEWCKVPASVRRKRLTIDFGRIGGPMNNVIVVIAVVPSKELKGNGDRHS
jgi:hypothetical protein